MAIDLDYIAGTTAHVLRCDHCEGIHPVAFPTAGSAWNHAVLYWDHTDIGETYHPECYADYVAWQKALREEGDTNG